MMRVARLLQIGGQQYDKWATVRTKWDEVFARNSDLILKERWRTKYYTSILFNEELATQDDINTTIESL